MTVASPTRAASLDGTGLSRAERVFLIVFALANLLIPVCMVEYYPFSMVPMYSKRLSEVSKYKVYAPNGRGLRVDLFGLDVVNLGSADHATTPFHRHRSRIPHYSSNVLGDPPMDEAAVVAAVRPVLIKMHIPYVTVEQTILGAVDGQRAGPLHTRTFTVTSGRP